jgi:hypothetical protein
MGVWVFHTSRRATNVSPQDFIIVSIMNQNPQIGDKISMEIFNIKVVNLKLTFPFLNPIDINNPTIPSLQQTPNN